MQNTIRHTRIVAAGMLITALLLILSLGATTRAQSINDTLYAFHEGDIWAWQPGQTPEQLTTWGYNSGPVIAPNGSLLAYRSVASEAVQEIEGGEGIAYAGDAPSNIYIMTVSNQNFERIAAQSAQRIWRSSPVFSPDSTRIAWAEMRGDFQPSVDVVVYDTRNGSTRTIAAIETGYQDAGFLMPVLQWGEGGIARLVYTFSGTGPGDAASSTPNLYWDIINPDTGAVSRHTVGDLSNPDNFIRTWFWAQHGGQEQIAYATQSGAWYVLNPQTGAREPLQSAPMLVRENGDRSVALTPVLLDTQTTTGVAWDFSSNGNTVRLPFEAYSVAAGADPAISPDGRYVGWNEFGTVRTWDSATQSPNRVLSSPNFNARVNLGPITVAWSPMRWVTDGRTGDSPTPTPVTPPDAGGCPLLPQLTVGMAVQVAQGQEPNRVRTQPSLAAPRTGLLFPGEVAIVQEGPVCADGLNWWRVSWSGVDGWTAEGADGTYWLVPSG